MKTPPVIGISAYSLQARWGNWDLPAVLLPRRYTDMVAKAGGTPVLLPPLPGVAGVLPRLDGLVLSGGDDIDPARYGAATDPHCGPANPERDDAELELCRTAIAAGLPLLGICRGLQVLNVALGGTLHQHLPDVVGHDGHSPESAEAASPGDDPRGDPRTPGSASPGGDPRTPGYGTHKVSIAAGTRLASVLQVNEVAVPTRHHQSIDRLAAGLVATAWTDDGVIEAAEFAATTDDSAAGARDPDDTPFLIAVQWHPEVGDDPSLFAALVAAASAATSR